MASFSKGYQKCSYLNCENDERHISLFRFPSKDKIRRLNWIENSGNPNLQGMTDRELSNRRLCASHFDPKYFQGGPRRMVVSRIAIPRHYSCDNDEMLTGNRDLIESHEKSFLRTPDKKHKHLETGSQGSISDEHKEDIPTSLSFSETIQHPDKQWLQTESVYETHKVISSWCDLLAVKLGNMDEYTRELVMNQIDNYMFRVKINQLRRQKLGKGGSNSTISCSANQIVGEDPPSSSGISSSTSSVGENLTTNYFPCLVKVKEEELDIDEDVEVFTPEFVEPKD